MRPRSWRFWTVIGSLGAAVAAAVNVFAHRPNAALPTPPAAAATPVLPMVVGVMYIPAEDADDAPPCPPEQDASPLDAAPAA
jgi:hypothetical protein